MGYKCPECKRDFEEKGELLDHFDIEKKCAASALVFLQKTLQVDFSVFEKAVVNEKQCRTPLI